MPVSEKPFSITITTGSNWTRYSASSADEIVSQVEDRIERMVGGTIEVTAPTPALKATIIARLKSIRDRER